MCLKMVQQILCELVIMACLATAMGVEESLVVCSLFLGKLHRNLLTSLIVHLVLATKCSFQQLLSFLQHQDDYCVSLVALGFATFSDGFPTSKYSVPQSVAHVVSKNSEGKFKGQPFCVYLNTVPSVGSVLVAF